MCVCNILNILAQITRFSFLEGAVKVEAMVISLMKPRPPKLKTIKPTPLLSQLPAYVSIAIKTFPKAIKPTMLLKHLPPEAFLAHTREIEDYALKAARPKWAAKPKPISKKQPEPLVELSLSDDSSMEEIVVEEQPEPLVELSLSDDSSMEEIVVED